MLYEDIKFSLFTVEIILEALGYICSMTSVKSYLGGGGFFGYSVSWGEVSFHPKHSKCYFVM